MDDKELKPCPFCGGKPDLVAGPGDCDGEDGPFAWVSCTVCGALTEREEYDVDAIAAWNKRAPDAKAEALAEALRLIAEATQRQQLPITAMVHALAGDALKAWDATPPGPRDNA